MASLKRYWIVSLFVIVMLGTTSCLGTGANLALEEKEVAEVVKAFQESITDQDYDKMPKPFTNPFLLSVGDERIQELRDEILQSEAEIALLLTDEEQRLAFLEGASEYFVSEMENLVVVFTEKNGNFEDPIVKALINKYAEEVFFVMSYFYLSMIDNDSDEPDFDQIISWVKMSSIKDNGLTLPQEAIWLFFGNLICCSRMIFM